MDKLTAWTFIIVSLLGLIMMGITIVLAYRKKGSPTKTTKKEVCSGCLTGHPCVDPEKPNVVGHEISNKEQKVKEK